MAKSLPQVLPNGSRENLLNQPDDLIAALAPVVSCLKQLKVRHYVGGSVASSFHGAVRSTMDVDIVCELADNQVSQFTHRLIDDYYFSEHTIRQAIQDKSCFNLIHLATSFKVDFFVSRGRPFDIDCLLRCNLEDLSEELKVAIATPEDSIIAKLEWYRIGNEASERQWDDVSKLIRLLGDEADWEYLHRAAKSVGVKDLLERLRHNN